MEELEARIKEIERTSKQLKNEFKSIEVALKKRSLLFKAKYTIMGVALTIFCYIVKNLL